MADLSNQEVMASVREAIARARIRHNLDEKQSAAISTLCDRLIASDPSLTWFIEEMRTEARAAAHDAARNGNDDIPWLALAQIL